MTSESHETDLLCTEEMLRETWEKLGVGKDGYLDKNELILVCDAIGMHKLADGIIRQLSDKINFNQKISFQELLTCVHQDETWLDVLNTSINKDSELHRSNDNVFPDSQTFEFVTLGPNGNGVIDTDVLIEIWDNIGMHAPKELLCELGFNSRQINITELAEELDRQLKGTIEQTNTDLYNNPSVAFLQATLSLYQAEIKCCKSISEQSEKNSNLMLQKLIGLFVVVADHKTPTIANGLKILHTQPRLGKIGNSLKKSLCKQQTDITERK